MTAGLEELEELLLKMGERLDTLEASVGALHVPLVRDSMVRGIDGVPSEISITADMPLDPADGFHALEYDSGGRPFRWTGAAGNVFRFSVPLDRRARVVANLALWAFGRVMADGPTSIACEVDGVRGIAKRSAITDVDAVFEVELPASPKRMSAVLAFEVPTGPPENSEDDREIGVPFRYLQVG